MKKNQGLSLQQIEEVAFERNSQIFTKPLGQNEVTNLCKSVHKQGYEFQCPPKHPEYSPICNKDLCKFRKLGIGSQVPDLIDDFEKWAAIKNMEKASVTDPEPTVSKPDLAGSQQNLALYRYLVGSKNLALTKRFLQQASNGQAASSGMVQAYMPAIEMIDDIVQAGPAYVNNLRALHKRAKKS